MNLAESILLLTFSILIIGGFFFFLFFLSNQDDSINDLTLTSSLCESSGGLWNTCGNKCQIINAGNPEVVCTQVCEELCECGALLGLTCPENYNCILPENIEDASSYCEQN